MILIGVLQPELKPIEELIQELISVMLFFDVNGHIVAIEVVEAETLGNEEYSLSKGELVNDMLELPEEINCL
jgi:hypothetical protein